jgi:hypothetical protein
MKYASPKVILIRENQLKKRLYGKLRKKADSLV